MKPGHSGNGRIIYYFTINFSMKMIIHKTQKILNRYYKCEKKVGV